MKEHLELRYLQRLAELYPTIAKASTEIINLQSILNLSLIHILTFNVTKKPDSPRLTLNAVLNQRSQDVLAANNWNVCQYALLLMMFAQVSGMEAGELLHVIADAHIYDRHIPLVKELISRETHDAPVVRLNPEIRNFYDFTVDDLSVENYVTGPQIKNIPIAV